MLISPLNISPLSLRRSSGEAFNPLTDIPDLRLYLAKNVATGSSWLDQSSNAFNFVQATGTKQPTIGANSVIYDGVDDSQVYTGANPLNYETLYVFFSGYYDSSHTTNYILTSADNSVDNKYVNLRVVSGKIGILLNDGTTTNIINGNTSLVNGAYYYGWIKFNNTGAAYEMSVNGVTQTLSVVVGFNNGKGFFNVSGRDNLSLGSMERLSRGSNYQNTNKIIASSAALTAPHIATIDNFMSVPTNY